MVIFLKSSIFVWWIFIRIKQILFIVGSPNKSAAPFFGNVRSLIIVLHVKKIWTLIFSPILLLYLILLFTIRLLPLKNHFRFCHLNHNVQYVACILLLSFRLSCYFYLIFPSLKTTRRRTTGSYFNKFNFSGVFVIFLRVV